MDIAIPIVAIAALTFCVTQFVDLMRRSDDEFPGRYDKPIWAAAILFANVLGAFVFFLCKPKAAPKQSEALRAELAAAKARAVDGLTGAE